jgi:hypothetical protein
VEQSIIGGKTSCCERVLFGATSCSAVGGSRIQLAKKGVQEPAIITHDKRGLSLRYRTHFNGQGSELAAEELRFEVHRARFVPVFSIL